MNLENSEKTVRYNNNNNNNNSILIYLCANSTAQGPITKLAQVNERK
jgi:hypothetical protein